MNRSTKNATALASTATITACWYANDRDERLCNACWRRTDILERGWQPETRTPVGSTCWGCGKEVS